MRYGALRPPSPLSLAVISSTIPVDTATFPQPKSPLKPLINSSSKASKGCHLPFLYPTGPYYPRSKASFFFSSLLFFSFWLPKKILVVFITLAKHNNKTVVSRGNEREKRKMTEKEKFYRLGI